MKTSVIIPCYLITHELIVLTKNTVHSLGEVGELIIIDNGSPMGGGYLRSVADVYVRNRENQSYAKSVNQGFNVSTHELRAVANNDVRVSPNWQKVAKEVFKNEDVITCHFRMTDYETPFVYGDETSYTGKERWGNGSFYVIKDTWHRYDEKFNNSYDDWDFFHSLRAAGYKTAYTNKACYQHNHSATKRETSWQDSGENREYFKKKWGEYPEDLYARLYPKQMAQDYEKGYEV